MRKSTILIQVSRLFSKLPCNNHTYFRQTSVLLIPEYQYLILFRTEYLRPPSTCQQILLFLFQQSRPFAVSLWVIVGCPKNTKIIVYNASLAQDFSELSGANILHKLQILPAKSDCLFCVFSQWLQCFVLLLLCLEIVSVLLYCDFQFADLYVSPLPYLEEEEPKNQSYHDQNLQ